MTVTELLEEWDHFTVSRRQIAVAKLFDLLLFEFAQNEDIIYGILELAKEYEDQDYFGTEGARI